MRLLVSVCLVMLFASGCGVLFGGNNAEACSNEYLALARLSPPEGAENVNERCSAGFNPTQNLSFTIAPDQLEAVQSSTSITNWQENAADPQGFENEAASIRSYLYGNFGNGAIYQVMLIDTSNPDRYSVYYSGAFVD